MGNAQLNDIDTVDEDFVDELKPGTKLMHGQYVIDKFLNAGGFGITYLAKDSLDRKIVIKECFPGAFCRRSKTIVQARSRAHQPELKSIVRLFVQEARSLSKLQHPNIVGVHQVFEDNDTAYMALDFVEGRDLLDTLEDPDHGLNPAQIKSILTDLLGAVGFVHEQKMLHRDISPDNILIDANLRPVLIDFGAAREQATKQSRVLSALRVVKDGYSPQEFYIAGSSQDPSSDLYALGASFYHLIANETPPNSQARLAAIASGEKDPYIPLVDRVKGYDRDFLAALDMSLRVLPKDRVQSAQDWIDMMNGTKAIVAKQSPIVPATDSAKPKSRMPMLMASVGVVALLGVVIATQTDLLTSPEVTQTTENTVSAVEAPTAEPQALEVAIADSNVVDEPAVAPEVVAVADPVDEIDVVIPAEPETSVSDIAAIIEELSNTNAEPSVTTDDATALVVESDDPVDAASEAAAVSPVEVASIPEAIKRPELRPEDLGVAPLPTPVVTPEIIADAVAAPTLPGFLTKLQDIPSSATPVLALPVTPEDTSSEAVALELDLPALVPGNEIIQVAAVVEEAVVPETAAAKADDILVLSAWSADLPFTASETQPNAIGTVTAVAPTWVSEGVVIKSVNGTPVSAISDIQPVLRESIPLDDATEVNVTFEVESDGVVVSHDWVMPVVQEFQLLNGMSFAARSTGDIWLTKVTTVPEGVATDLAVGDELIAYMPTTGRFETRTALKDVLDEEVAAGKTQFSFAVNRDDSMWVVGLEYNPNPEND